MFKAPVRLDHGMGNGTGCKPDHNIRQHARASVCVCEYKHAHMHTYETIIFRVHCCQCVFVMCSNA